MSDRTWYYAAGQDKQGPFSDSELKQLCAAGTLARTTLIWTDGQDQWKPAGQTPGLFPDAATIPPPLPPMAYALPPADDIGQNAGMRMLIPVGRSGWAIAAGYLGLLSVVLLPAPFALITGIIAVRHIRQNPKVHGMGRAIFGIVMGALCTVFLIVMLLSVIIRHH